MLDRGSSSTGDSPLTRFAGGLWKVASAPLQLPVTVLQTSFQRNIVYGTTIGTVQGVGRGVGNVVTGTVQVFSAVIPPNPLDLVQRKLDYMTGKVTPAPVSSLSGLLGGSPTSSGYYGR